ncbi:unnamed protein product [Brassicogethes aeneus]|uniref:Apolipophorin-III n=1 Tax=Brassicogethes aeneus TaxID=1431903 RepID=A0A9P0AWW8_BRAAE|nr:unnamed protein product [Brassicogethes aeneus]
MYKFCVVLACLLVISVNAKPKKAEPTEMETLAQNTQKMVDDLTATLKKDMPDSKKVVDVIKTNTDALAANVQSVVTTMNKNIKAHEGDIQKSITKIQTDLESASKSLKTALGEDTVKKAQEVKENFDKTIKEAMQTAQKMMANAEPEIKKTAKTMFDGLMDIAKKVNKELTDNLATKQ